MSTKHRLIVQPTPTPDSAMDRFKTSSNPLRPSVHYLANHKLSQ